MGSEVVRTEYGLMSKYWNCSPLGELCIDEGGVQTGPFGSQLHNRDYVSHGTPIITVEHLGENRILHQNLPCVTDADKKRLSRFILQKGDIVFSRVGSVDRRVLIREAEEGWLFSGRCLRVRPKDNLVDSGYLSWFFAYPGFKEFIRRIAVGATMPSLNTKILKSVPIYFPSFPEQRSIAHILGSLDDKIELNRQMNETLEAIARAIFKSWFVDFDPVRAKTEGHDPGLLKEIADLFPDGFEDSDLGKIPKGWGIASIGNLVTCVGGSTPSTKKSVYWNNGVHAFITPKDMSTLSSPVVLSTSRLITDEGVNKISSGQLPKGTVLLSSRAPIGYLAVTEIPVSINQGIIAMICNQMLPNLYVLYWAKANMDTIINNASGTTFLEISKRNFRPIKVIVPSINLLNIFVSQIRSYYDQVVQNLREQEAIISLRNTLLPKLISGELRIPDVEKLIKEAGL